MLRRLDTLIKRGFWVIQKITANNLSKHFQDIIFISFSTSSENPKTSTYITSTLGGKKSIFHNFLALILVN